MSGCKGEWKPRSRLAVRMRRGPTSFGHCELDLNLTRAIEKKTELDFERQLPAMNEYDQFLVAGVAQ